ncbi:MAG: hypothetical protein KTR28_02210 [Micavibrio sp.]|nr:hypothetical protein [Micavibrio sp.]
MSFAQYINGVANTGSLWMPAISAFSKSGKNKGQKPANQFQWQYDKDKEFAQNAIQWRVNDAKQAGLHPLSALGQSPAMSNSASYIQSPEKGVDFHALGQGIDRAANAGRNQTQRELDNLRLERAKLENDYLKTQIAGSAQAITNSGKTTPAQAPSTISGQGRTRSLPADVIASAINDVSREAGSINSYAFTKPTRTGVGLVPSKQMKERIEDDFIGQLLWHLEHRVIAPPHPDKDKFWNPLAQKYQPRFWKKKYWKKRK